MRLHQLLAIVAGIFLGTLLIHAASAQPQSTAIITGTITDPSGAAVVGATISAQLVDSKAVPASVQSGPDGRYSIDAATGDATTSQCERRLSQLWNSS